MRYDMLNRLRRDVVQNQHQCRRYGVLTYFETIDPVTGASRLDKNYKCGFCDTCNPSLNFVDKGGRDREESEPLGFANDLLELDPKFRAWLVSSEIFSIETAEFYIQSFKDYPVDTYAKATRILDTSNPRNLKALYIARHFAGLDEKLKYSIRLLETANTRQRLDLDTVWTLYETTEESLKPQVFPVLCDELGMLLKSTGGEQWLFSESEDLLRQGQVDRETVELLGMRVIANELPKLNLSNIKNRITELMEEF